MQKYPDLSTAKYLGVDIETYDPDLTSYGPSVYGNRGREGRILGVALSDGVFSDYYNMETDSEYIAEQLSHTNTKVGHNIIYDIDWLTSRGFKVNGKWVDTGICAALLNENEESYSLDELSYRYLGEHSKGEDKLEKWCASNDIKISKSKAAQSFIYLMPYDVVRPYALQDAKLVIELYSIMREKLRQQDLEDLADMENELLRCVLHFRQTGVRYDKDKAVENSLALLDLLGENKEHMHREYGDINPNSSKQIAEHLKALAYEVPYKEETGNPSITKQYLTSLRNKYLDNLYEGEEIEEGREYEPVSNLPTLLYNIRTITKSRKDYLDGIYNNFLCPDGKIHCTFHTVRGDMYGTRSGRFSASQPNLQQITSPERDSVIGKMCREPFIPFEDCMWGKIDYSQIEYRFIAHYARGPGSSAVRERYSDNPEQDYHQYIQDKTGLARPFAKNLNFGLAFGMGARKMSVFFGWSLPKCYEMISHYHKSVPFVKYTADAVSNKALQRGYIMTLLGRRARLVENRKAYIMFNRLIQGSAADLMKKALITAYNSGIFTILHPHLTVHDEIDVSVPNTLQGKEAFKELKYIMETCVSLKVPVYCEAKIGPNWAELWNA